MPFSRKTVSRPARQKTRTADLDRLRIFLNGHHTTAELRQMLNEAVDKIEAMAITHVGTPKEGCVLYVKLSDHRGDPLTSLGPYKDVLKDGIAINGPYRSAAEEHGL